MTTKNTQAGAKKNAPESAPESAAESAKESTKLMLSARGIGLTYGSRARRTPKFVALEDVSFEVYSGETLGIIGTNGSGKSSLLRILAGIHLPDEGRVESFGHAVSLLSLQAGFLAHLTGRENALLSGMLLGHERAFMRDHMDFIVEFTGLEAFIDKPLNTYSSGMRARLGFVVALLAEPDVLLIDEVLGVGDEEFRLKSTKALRERIDSNKTVVLVSHSTPTIKSLCDRVVWLDHGRLVAEGATEEVIEAYLRSFAK